MGAVVVALGIALVVYARITTPPPQPSTPLLASARGGPGGSAVDGIQCQASEGAVQHVHAHLAVYVNGSERAIPASVGIPGSCLYWTHTHDQSGVIHVEAPNSRTFTLGNFFDVWGQPLSSRRVGPAQGAVTAYVDGRKYTDDPRAIPLSSHTEIQLDVGAPAPAPKPYGFPSGL